jgi:hypothetical protein
VAIYNNHFDSYFYNNSIQSKEKINKKRKLTRTIKVICIVTIFAGLLLLSIKFKIKPLHPDTRICTQSKSCTRINFLAPVQLCTAILRQCLRAGFVYRDKILGSMLACTAIAPARYKNLYPDCKNCAMLRSLRLWWDNLHSQDALSASIRLSTTNALYCRAVMLKQGPLQS